MALPVVERIALQIVTRLELITTANGYTFDATVTRPKRVDEAYRGVDRDLVLIQAGREEDEDHTTEGDPSAVAWWQSWMIGTFVVPSDKDTLPFDTLCNLREADVMKALTTPEDLARDWGEFNLLAINAEIRQPSDLVDARGICVGVGVSLRVLYRHAENDPTLIA